MHQGATELLMLVRDQYNGYLATAHCQCCQVTSSVWLGRIVALMRANQSMS